MAKNAPHIPLQRSLKNKLITVFGGNGFIGTSLIMRLAREGARIRVAVRNTDKANHLRVFGDVGQVMPVQTSLHDPKAITEVIKGSDIVINLLGILFEKGNSTFHAIHVNAAKHIAQSCANQGISRLIHMSALGASSRAKSLYAKSKGQGETQIAKFYPTATIIRPSVVFGPQDNFLNTFARLGSVLPIMATFHGGATKMQPVYVGDVAEAIMTCIHTPKTKGKIFELGGPETYTLKELMDFSVQCGGRKKHIVSLPTPLARFMAHICKYMPNPLITPDQLILLKSDNVVAKNSKGLKELGVSPSHLEAIAPLYLGCYQKQF